MILAFLGVSLLLLLIFFSGTFARVLAEAAEGNYPAGALFSLFGLKAISSLMLVLPLSFFLSILLALGRLYRDNEMTALFACGFPPSRLLRTVTGLAFGVAVVVAGLSLYLGPWAEEQRHRVLDEAAATNQVEGVAAGRFTTLDGGESLIYVEAISNDRSHLRQVFARGEARGRSHVVMAQSAHRMQDPETGQTYLVLENGYRYEGRPGEPDFRIIAFAKHGLRLKTREVEASSRRRDALPTADLVASSHPADRAELHWRLSMPLSVLLLGWLAVPLGRVNPRQGRYGKLFAGVMIYLIYNNLLTVGQSWLAKGRVPEAVGLWWVHLLLLVLLLLLLFPPGWRGRRR